MTAVEVATDRYASAKTQSFFEVRSYRPLSVATDTIDTEFEDESDFDDESMPKRSFDSVSDVKHCNLKSTDSLTGREPEKKYHNDVIIR